MAIAYQYDAGGYYVCPVEDYGILPNNATYTEPREREGHIPRWNGEAWVQVENHLGKEGYLNGEAHTIREYGPLPTGWSLTPPPPTLEEAKDKARSDLREKRRSVEYGGFELNGQRWDSAEKDELRLNSITRLFDGGLETYEGWKISEGVYVTLTPELVQQATLAFMQHYSQCFAVEAAKLAEIDALTTVGAVEAWTKTELNTGW